MLSTKLERFILKRVLIVCVLLTIADIVFFEHKWLILLGLLLGGIFSILKFSITSSMYTYLFGLQNKQTIAGKSILFYVLSQLATIVLMIVSILLNLNLFIGVTAGILLVPSVLFINALTEGFGITHNNFE